ncbi:hypothetical protein Zmor_020651 [Zophobas morio]|uniref:Sulfatase N-terminal domain-containing protein n=1 Tax=Zophobas morio TaxID=2755281 RepID=A0AA38I718_9CUCU|nr:hypothetical protein Zmor_020651 [Zophobas morio]
MPALKRRYWIMATITIAAVLLGIILYFVLVPEDVPITRKKPHIIIIMADDLGRNDVGFHGSNQIPTPNIDALAYNGIILDKFYTQYACTPSRAALLTGNYPLRYGIHGSPIRAGQNRSLPEDVTTMPEHLKKLGYKTHLVGKWHLGAAYKKSTPLRRGFDTHFGYWHGFVGYFDYTAIYELTNETNAKGLDVHDGFQPVWSAQGKYATELFTEKAVEVIDGHDGDEPLFLFLAHLAPHTGTDGTELGVPNSTLSNIKYEYIKDPRRRLYADVVNLMDESVGKVVEKLSDKNMLQNSIILFLSDNGAQTVGVYENSGSNWPLRGLKLSEFEGGVRAAAAIFSPLFEKSGYVNKELIHLTDLLPTFFVAAGGDPETLGTIDGINQWDTLSKNLSTNRTEVLLNINEVENASAIITNSGRYKFLQGTYNSGSYDHHYGDGGRGPEVPPFSVSTILESSTYEAIRGLVTAPLTNDKVKELRAQTDLSWCRNDNETYPMDCRKGCLFNLDEDPCEITNIIETEKEIEGKLRGRLDDFKKVMVPQPEEVFDEASNPIFYNNTWCTWLDDDLCFKTPKLQK